MDTAMITAVVLATNTDSVVSQSATYSGPKYLEFVLFSVLAVIFSALAKWATETNMSEKTNANPQDEALSDAIVNAVNKWTDRYGHTKVGKALKFLGFGSK